MWFNWDARSTVFTRRVFTRIRYVTLLANPVIRTGAVKAGAGRFARTVVFTRVGVASVDQLVAFLALISLRANTEKVIHERDTVTVCTRTFRRRTVP